MKFTGIATPDGIVHCLEGPFSGKDNDWTMYQGSRIERRLQRIMSVPSRTRLFCFGDKAYLAMTTSIMAPFTHPGGRAMLAPKHKQFNKLLAKYRITVEHAFGDVSRYWGFATYGGRRLRSGQMAVAAFFKVAVLLNNCRCCLRGNLTSNRYKAENRPTLEEYLLLPEGYTLGVI